MHRAVVSRDAWVSGTILEVAWLMPYGLHRYQQAESLHFITFSCYHRLPYLAGLGAKLEFEQELERLRLRHGARVYAYVLMPEHVHLLMNEPPAILLSEFLKALKQQTSKALKRGRKQFWQARYFDKNLRGDAAMRETIRYIHRNPVKRVLVVRSEEYPWSSFRHYATGHRGVVEIESEWTARWRETGFADRLKVGAGPTHDGKAVMHGARIVRMTE